MSIPSPTAQLNFAPLRRFSYRTIQLPQHIENFVYTEPISGNRAIDAPEGEHQRIASELHDSTSQFLTAIALVLKGLTEQIEFGNPR